MPQAVLFILALAFALGTVATFLARALGHRLNALDGPGVVGQVKAATRRVPNTGGIGIFAAIALPMAAGLLAINSPLADRVVEVFPALAVHLKGIASQTIAAAVLLAALTIVHVMGVIDDRRPLGATFKLVVMLAVATGLTLATQTRLLSFLDAWPGGSVVSILATVLWIVVVTNAINFIDNMDGLSGGVAAIAASCFLAATLVNGQWFIAVMLALLVGALLGFLVFNFPRRADGGGTVFMGDGGSLVVGLLLAFLTVRTTYIHPATDAIPGSGAWYAVLMPLVVLAVPLYDFASVVIIRLRQGRSPFVGDLQHLSHRLVRRGLSRRDAVITIYGLTGITSIGGIALGSLAPYQAVLVGVQTVLVLLVLALYEGRATSAST